ncbi:MAG: hypothetical protein FWC60_05345 [Firmicutes bacterium]|nr:hypothetical protein [Bacillota bacterium]
MIRKLADYFNVTADYLLGITDDPGGAKNLANVSLSPDLQEVFARVKTRRAPHTKGTQARGGEAMNKKRRKIVMSTLFNKK